MTAIDWACRKCAQQPKEWCRVVSPTGEVGPVVENMLHQERILDANTMERLTADTVGRDEFMRAIEGKF